MATREWILKKNCSITPKQLAQAYMALCGASFLVAGYFFIRGAWVVMAFATIEMAAVAAAFIYFGRHANDRECISLGEAGLIVELIEAEQSRQFRMDPFRTRVAIPRPTQRLIGLEANDERVEVGRYLPERRRREFAQELSRELVDYRLGDRTN
jgi:uncharacterized membrane protein